jgi:hypothetical protein
MAQQLDLQEQEQVDALKAFWKQYGNLITWTSRWCWPSSRASTCSGRSTSATRPARRARCTASCSRRPPPATPSARRSVFGDMKAKSPKTTYTQLGALLAAKAQADKGDTPTPRHLQWVADNGNEENAAVAHLRLAGLLADAKKYDDALKQLALVKPASFARWCPTAAATSSWPRARRRPRSRPTSRPTTACRTRAVPHPGGGQADRARRRAGGLGRLRRRFGSRAMNAADELAHPFAGRRSPAP